MRTRAIALLLVIAAVVAGVPMFGGSPSTTAAPVQIGRIHDFFQPEDGKIFVLLIGHDARPGEVRARADAIHIAGINTKTMKGGILNFPRDSWVNIPGRGFAKINEAYFSGGPELLAQTLENLTGIRIDYWVTTGFEGFQEMVRALGGVRMNLPYAISDIGGSGAQLRAGKQKLKGYEALAYVRTRKPFLGGDATRTTNQGRFLLAALKKLRNEVGRNPAALLKWMNVIRREGRLNMSREEMYRLAILTSQVPLRRVSNVTVPVSLGFVGPLSVVHISPAARSLYARFRQNGSL
jgi:LCP family protein required for cell wall assembly